MSDLNEDNIDYEALRSGLYGDIFLDKTERVGRNLLLVSTATVLVSVFNVSAKSAPLIPIDFSNQPDSLVMFLAVANVALLVAYIFRLVPDLLRAQEKWAETKIFIDLDRIKREQMLASATENAVHSQMSDRDQIIDDWWEQYEKNTEKIRERIHKMVTRATHRRFPMWFRNVRLFLSAGSPLLLGALAFVHTANQVSRFAFAVFGL